jgi:hypothetical protein
MCAATRYRGTCQTTEFDITDWQTQQSALQRIIVAGKQLVQRAAAFTAFAFGKEQAKLFNFTAPKRGPSEGQYAATVGAAMRFSTVPKTKTFMETALSECITGFCENDYDRRVQRGTRKEREGYSKRLRLGQWNVEEHIGRLHSLQVQPPLTTKLSIEGLYNGKTKSEWRVSSRLRATYSRKCTQDLCASVPDYVPELPDGQFAVQDCQQVKLAVRDNKEFWLNQSSRLVDGVRVQSRLLHCVTGERCPIPLSLVQDVLPLPQDSAWAPQAQQINLATKFPMPIAERDAWLKGLWSDYVGLYLNSSDSHRLLARPDPGLDPWKWGRQVTYHSKIHMETGTSESADLEKILDALIEEDPECLWLLGGDQQTIGNAWPFIQMAKYRKVCVLPGELHEKMHDAHASICLGWTYHIEPICLLTGNLKIQATKFYAKQHNDKQRLIMLTLAAGCVYLAKTVTDTAVLTNPQLLLRKTADNKPLHDFVFWMLYCALPYRASVNATRLSDSSTRDTLWRYNMYKYACTNKKNYKLLCLMFGQVTAVLMYVQCTAYQHIHVHMCAE